MEALKALLSQRSSFYKKTFPAISVRKTGLVSDRCVIVMEVVLCMLVSNGENSTVSAFLVNHSACEAAFGKCNVVSKREMPLNRESVE